MAKLKNIWSKYRKAVHSGRWGGHRCPILVFFELCERIWGGLPAKCSIEASRQQSCWKNHYAILSHSQHCILKKSLIPLNPWKIYCLWLLNRESCSGYVHDFNHIELAGHRLGYCTASLAWCFRLAIDESLNENYSFDITQQIDPAVQVTRRMLELIETTGRHNKEKTSNR